MNSSYRQMIPIFFAVDDNYAPFLGVALRSMLSNADPTCFYRIHILTEGLSNSNVERILAEQTENSRITFDDISEAVARIAADIHVRDYYSAATYYRVFIGNIYTEYDRVLYLDSDIVFKGDVAKMYDTNIGDKLIGAVREDVMAMEKVFGDYAEVVVGVPVEKYFNAGILLIDLKKYRELGMEERFIELLRRRRFTVAQDQDYLNLLCLGMVHYFDSSWNHTSVKGALNDGREPNIVHYKMDWKPWHYDGVLFEELFWEYADATAFSEELHAMKERYSIGEKMRDRAARERLAATAYRETIAYLSDALVGGDALSKMCPLNA